MAQSANPMMNPMLFSQKENVDVMENEIRKTKMKIKTRNNDREILTLQQI